MIICRCPERHTPELDPGGGDMPASLLFDWIAGNSTFHIGPELSRFRVGGSDPGSVELYLVWFVVRRHKKNYRERMS